MPDYHCPMPTPDGGVCGGELRDRSDGINCRKCLVTLTEDEVAALRAQHEEMERLRGEILAVKIASASWCTQSEQAEARAAELEALVRWADDKLSSVEISPCNYDHSHVLELNSNATEVVLAFRAVLSGAAPQAEKGGDDA